MFGRYASAPGEIAMKSEWKAAIRVGDVPLARALAKTPEVLNSRNEHGQTALMLAARQGQSDLVRVLVDAGAELDVAAKDNLTALMLAVINGHSDVARVLIGAGADLGVRGPGAPGFANKTALDLARARELNDVVQAIEVRLGRPE